MSTPQPTRSPSTAQAQAFAFRLLHALPGAADNLVFSPADVAANLAALHQAARGDTAQQIEHLLGTEPASASPMALNHDGVTWRAALALWVQAGPALADAALRTFCASTRAECHAVDFQDRSAATATVNDWVARQTNGLIDALVGPADLTGPLLLTSTLYLKAPWEFPPFKRNETRPLPFTRRDGSQVLVPMMRRFVEGEIPCAWTGPWAAAQMRYRGGRLALVLVVPKPEAFDAVAERLGPAFLDEVDAALRPQYARLVLPRFTVGSRVSLREPLGRLGLTDLFTPGRADLSGLAPAGWFLNDVLHQALLTVDEEGTEAAAASADMVTMGGPPSLVFDRPFFFFLRNAHTGAVLFLGRVLDPSR